MKILEAQSATLTNYEVLQHLDEARELRNTRLAQWQERTFGPEGAAARAKKAQSQTKQKAKTSKRIKDGAKDEPSHRRPGNLETIDKALHSYFAEAPNPLAATPFPYNENTIKNLFQALRPWDFTKAEMIMIVNLRPTKPEALNTIVEQMEDRFPGDEVQLEICQVIAQVLGKPDVAVEAKAMADNAETARQGQKEDVKVDGMDIDE